MKAKRNYCEQEVPYFKYHPDPLETGAFRTDKTVLCGCCQKEADIYYAHPCYSEEEVEYICPWCIADGSASERFNCEFLDPAYVESDAAQPLDKGAIEDLTARTPSYTGWEEGFWLSHCGAPCAFAGYANWHDVENYLDRFADLDGDCEKIGMNREDLERYLRGDGCRAYLFRCLHCGKYRLYA